MFKTKSAITFIIFVLVSKVYSKSRHFKILKADFHGFEPYSNITYFKVKPINRYLSVINANGFLKRSYRDGMVNLYYLCLYFKSVFNILRPMDNFSNWTLLTINLF